MGVAVVSIHVPLAEHDATARPCRCDHTSFNSRAPRGARRAPTRAGVIYDPVSIHVPLAEHDGVYRQSRRYAVRFNSRAPRGARLG